MGLKKTLRRLERRWLPGWSRERRRLTWQDRWSRDDFHEPWMGSPTSKAIVEALDTGWFPEGGLVLDIGCGRGEVSHWLWEHGRPALGVDFAPAAIEHARARFGEIPGCLEYRTLDIVRDTPPLRPYAALLDRGCFHSIPPSDSSRYVDHVAMVSTPGTPFLLFISAFRGKLKLGHAEERAFHDRRIEALFGEAFEILRSRESELNAENEESRPGIVYWMERR